MSEPDDEDLALFAAERHPAEEVQALLDDAQADPTRLRAALAGLCADYQALLHRFAKVARLSDASHRRLQKAREELDRQNELLRDNLRLQEEVERISRHDLKTPLASILSVPGLLRQSPALGPREHGLLDLLHQAGLRMLQMVDLSLDLFRMERGTYPFAPEPLDVGAVAARVVQDLRALAGERGVEVQVEAAGAPPAAAEELLTYSMLANLVKNALEASRAGQRVRVQVAEEDGAVVVRVSNPAVVPAALRADFFARYHGSDKPGGSGLGTYSARLMATTQKGTIAMATSEDAGTTVTVTLPRSLAAAPAPAPAAEGRLAPLRILVAEDDAIQRALLEHVLARPPLEVVSVGDGRAALEAAERLLPDVVLMDLEMPHLNGLVAVAALRAMEGLKQCRAALIVGLSAHEDEETERRFRAAGCDYVLVKPVEPERLLALIQEPSKVRY